MLSTCYKYRSCREVATGSSTWDLLTVLGTGYWACREPDSGVPKEWLSIIGSARWVLGNERELKNRVPRFDRGTRNPSTIRITSNNCACGLAGDCETSWRTWTWSKLHGGSLKHEEVLNLDIKVDQEKELRGSFGGVGTKPWTYCESDVRVWRSLAYRVLPRAIKFN